MKICKYKNASGQGVAGLVREQSVLPLRYGSRDVTLSEVLDAPHGVASIQPWVQEAAKLELARVELLPPIDQQEVWAAGVTYVRSKAARMEESESAASCYDRVYVSPRPELFLKATPHRVVGHGQPIRIRYDATWNVPEPELTLVLNARLQLVGFTIGNDMSSRDIEGENPLYLPQAKVYDSCCGLGPWITLRDAMPPDDQIGIQLRVLRDGSVAFAGETSSSQLARTFDELIHWLTRENSFPHGAFLMTGTGIVPDSDFTLQPGDSVEITMDGIGTLQNSVVQNPVPAQG